MRDVEGDSGVSRVAWPAEAHVRARDEEWLVGIGGGPIAEDGIREIGDTVRTGRAYRGVHYPAWDETVGVCGADGLCGDNALG